MTREELDEALFAADKLCAVAFLGYSTEQLNVSAPGLLATGGYNWMYPFLGRPRASRWWSSTGTSCLPSCPGAT